jgi:hypothetical protein
MNGTRREDNGRFDSVFREIIPPENPNKNRRYAMGELNPFQLATR